MARNTRPRGGFFDGMARGIELSRIAQASVGPDGKPDMFKAKRMADLKGLNSREDHIKLVAIIDSMGGFDKKPSSSTTYYDNDDIDTDDDDWRDNCEDGSEWDIDPYDYDTEEEYLEALHEVKYEWREYAEDGEIWGLDPEDFETEEEYEEALEEAMNEWDDSEDDKEFGEEE